jgi:hypothetical protein
MDSICLLCELRVRFRVNIKISGFALLYYSVAVLRGVLRQPSKNNFHFLFGNRRLTSVLWEPRVRHSFQEIIIYTRFIARIFEIVFAVYMKLR